MSKKILVTGASGHLGSSLTKTLSQHGYQVISGVRDIKKSKNNKISGEITYIDLLKPETITTAMDGVDTLIQVAANFSHWAKDPQKEIVQANRNMVKNVFEAAHEAAVTKIIFVSSTGALAGNTTGELIKPDSWCKNSFNNPYFQSKVETEQLAWSLAEKYNIEMISVLPSAMINNDLSHTTPTTRFLQSIFNGELPFDLEFDFNVVNIEDVCEAISQASSTGVPSQRYILANENGISIKEIAALAKKYNSSIKKPIRIGKTCLLALASIAELSKYINIEPKLLKSQIKFYYNKKENYDISLAREHLGFSPRSITECLDEYFESLSLSLP